MASIDEATNLLLKILYSGLLWIRANPDDRELCFREADHLHNIPSAVRERRWELITYYCDVIRLGYIECGSPCEFYQSLWEQLDSVLAEWKKETEVGVAPIQARTDNAQLRED